MTPYVIAEMGICHHGSLDRALTMVEIAWRAGASAVKTQYWSSTEKLRQRMHSGGVGPTNDYLNELRTREAWLPILSDAVKVHRMEFMCTVDLFEDITIVAQYVDRFKIASWGATDQAFIRAHQKFGKGVVLSLGTLSASEMMQARLYAIRPLDWLLHCVSAYPAQLSELNLKVIQTEFLDGFSDHTGKSITGALAVMAGAKVLEVHYRAEDTPADNPDYAHSLNPEDLRVYIGLAKTAYRALGDGIKRCTPGERVYLRHRYIQL